VRGCAGLGADERGGTGPDTTVEGAEGAAGFGRQKEVPCGGEAVPVGCKEVGGFVGEGWPAGFQGSVLPMAAKIFSKEQKHRTIDQIKTRDEIRADDGCGEMDDGRRAEGGRAEGCGPWTVDRGPWAMSNGR
jgi:hypothetical protein